MRRLIQPVKGTLDAVIRPPGSKSITNRALLIAAMAGGESTLRGALDSDDTQKLIDCLHRLGIEIKASQKRDVLTVAGCGGNIPNASAEMLVGNSGTTIRFLTAALAIAGGTYQLDGIERMRERPIGDLVEALKDAGVEIDALSAGGCPPVKIASNRWEGGTIRIRGNVSSQYLSGLMMAAPLAEGPVIIEVGGELVSQPYIDMTISVMQRFSVAVEQNVKPSMVRQFRIAGGQSYRGSDYEIEPDASAASYFWAAAAICGGSVTVLGLDYQSLQGDVNFVDVLKQAGCRVERLESDWNDATVGSLKVTGPATSAVNVDMSDISDTAQTLAAVALFLPGKTTITGVGHNRVKETDRIGNLAIELRKLGATVEEFDDGMSIEVARTCGAEIETYDDHRMAMSLALVGLRQEGVEILDAGCVSKTYPQFFEDLETVTGTNS